MTGLEVRALFSTSAYPDPLETFPTSPIVGNPNPIAETVPLGNVPQLSSHPSSAAKLYLDFVGAKAQTWGPYNVPVTPAYDTNGDPSTFSSTELDQIHEVWSRVSEKYSPFNVDVTTVDPGTYPTGQVARVVIGGAGAWAGGVYGGFSYVGGFTGNTSNTGWVFNANLGAGRPSYVAEAAAHEAGHLFGLTHQSLYDSSGNKIDEYRGGRSPASPDPTAPIMGFSYYATRGVWAKGTSADGPNDIQDDLDILSGAANAFGYRDDDHGNTRLTADVLNVIDDAGRVGASGIIERMADIDYFRFTTPGGAVNLSANVMTLGPMLDLALKLTDADGNLLASADTSSLGETIDTDLLPGDYYLAVSSHGAYGDLGQYTITGTVPEPTAIAVGLLGVGALLQRRQPDRAVAPRR